MSTKRIKQMENAAHCILAKKPDPAAKLLLLRDVLRVSSNNTQLKIARKELKENIWIKQLTDWQCTDGGWGRFHTQPSKTDSPIPKTEFAVDRALALGLQKNDPLLTRASKYITDLLQERISFPDPAENNARWPVGWRLFCAGMLAKFDPNNKVLNKSWVMWSKITQDTFASGKYDPAQEVLTHSKLTGAPADLRYLKIDNKYSVSLIGSYVNKLPPKIEKALVTWLWNKTDGIMYYGMCPSVIPKSGTAGAFDRWLCSHELLSVFPTWHKLAAKTTDWFWAQQNQDGLWDLGPRDPKSFCLPLSATWRNKQNRINDWSTRILKLLRKFEDN